MMKINELAPGQIIEARPRRKQMIAGSTMIAEEVDETAEPIRGRVMAVDRKTGDVTVKTPAGTERIFNWIEFVVKILPLLDAFFFWVLEKIEWFKQRRKAKKGGNDKDEGKSEVVDQPKTD